MLPGEVNPYWDPLTLSEVDCREGASDDEESRPWRVVAGVTSDEEADDFEDWDENAEIAGLAAHLQLEENEMDMDD
ncbi:uncharacterized protein PG998_009285 [Apiospora kogelbergensis]|uniref:uncharacterized protein n=1 Tax=Apiospora kogelbergensis TaxID=1337665 RepID=UPI00312E0106